jgi:hypothetical protein
MSTPRTGREVIKRAIELLKRDGWRQGADGPRVSAECGARCMRGALLAASEGTGPYLVAVDRVRDVLSQRYHGAHTAPTTFNDSRGRTVEQVIDVLEEAAK